MKEKYSYIVTYNCFFSVAASEEMGGVQTVGEFLLWGTLYQTILAVGCYRYLTKRPQYMAGL